MDFVPSVEGFSSLRVLQLNIESGKVISFFIRYFPFLSFSSFPLSIKLKACRFLFEGRLQWVVSTFRSALSAKPWLRIVR